MHGNICTRAQCNAVKKAAEEDQPFPIKAVVHKRVPRTQDRPGLQEFEENTLSSQPRGHLMPLENPSGGIRETTTSFHSQKKQSDELQMTRAIQEKELLLQEKLCRLEEKIRQTIQSGSADTAAGYEHKNGKERQYSGQELEEIHIKGRLSEYQRTPLRTRDMLDGESLLEDLMQLRIKQGRSTEDRIRNTRDLQQARWDPSEHTTNSVQTNLRLEKLNEPFRRKREVEKNDGAWKETEARYREPNEATVGNATWTREKKYKERTQRDNDGLDNQQNMSQKRLATENQKHTGENQPNESTLPLLSGSFDHSQQQQTLPCEICNRTFLSDRLEKHTQICAKLRKRQEFKSFDQRYKGSDLEEYFKTHKKQNTPEVVKRKNRQNHKRNM